MKNISNKFHCYENIESIELARKKDPVYLEWDKQAWFTYQ